MDIDQRSVNDDLSTLVNKHQSMKMEFENALKDCKNKRISLMRQKDKSTTLVADLIDAENNAVEMEAKLNNLARLIQKGKNMYDQKVEKVVAPSPNIKIKMFNEPKVEDTNSPAPVQDTSSLEERIKEAERDLEHALPALTAAQQATQRLDKNTIVELKRLSAPPEAVIKIGCVMSIMMGFKNKESNSATYKALLADKNLFNRMINFNAMSMNEKKVNSAI